MKLIGNPRIYAAVYAFGRVLKMIYVLRRGPVANLFTSLNTNWMIQCEKSKRTGKILVQKGINIPK